MHWTLWTMLIAVVLLAIEYLVLRCIEVSDTWDGPCHSAELPVWAFILIGALAFAPVINLIVVIAAPIVVAIYIEDEYCDIKLKDPKSEENKDNIMLMIISFLARRV